MTERENVTVNDPHGPVNNGDGHQHNYYGVAADWMIRKGVESLRISLEDRLRLADRFVRPVGYRSAADRLEKPGSILLLKAPSGSGRRAAAIMLLHELGEDADTDGQEGRFDELPTTETEEGRGTLTPERGDRFLLDLSRIADAEEYAESQRRLAVQRSQVQEAGAHMVVVLPWGMEHALSPDLEPHTVRLVRPRGVAVVTRHLRMNRMAFRSADLGGADLRRLCDHSPMRELARLAELVRAARDGGRFGTDFAGWLDEAIHAVTDRAGEVSQQMKSVLTAPERALLLTTAVFEEVQADTVYEAWRGLMRTVGHEEEATTELARTDFGARLADLGVERGPDGRLRFERLAYADALRTYFWTNFPGIRDDLRDWIGHAAGLPGLTTDDRVKVVVRFAEHSLAVGRPDHLINLVVRWTDSAAGTSRDPRAVAALELGLSHEGFGGRFRSWMYTCVTSRTLPDGLVRVLTTACLQNLAATHPDQAMVRLRHLAVRDGEAAREAREALLGLLGRDHRRYQQLLESLRNRARRERQRAEPQLRLLTELLRSDQTPEPPPWPDLFRGWETVFSQPPTQLWNPMVSSWLDAAAGDASRDAALGGMVAATHGRTTALHRLYAIACDWSGLAPGPSRAAVATRFWEHIDQAQYACSKNAKYSGAGPRIMEEGQ
ncbi:hypothetical protein [Streptomyces sp. NPDC002176]|uniref:hypothetical protein n=1 Tax=Streptomyces sp. NPDC002176 TaxID=3364634 RepID=UPI00384DD554